jgi:NitT/TauT family transport system permease protein
VLRLSVFIRAWEFEVKAVSLIRIAVVAGFIGLIELLCRSHVIPSSVLIPPSAMVTHGIDLLRSGKFDHDIATSLVNIVVASIVSVLLGFVLGLAIHALPSVRRSIEPLLSSYYAVPTFIFYPVFIVILGIGSLPIIAIAVLLSVVTMITATLNGLDRIPRALRKSAQVMRLSRWRAAFYITLPASLPYLFTGVKLAVAYAFIGVIASEFILSGSGIGYAIGYAYNNFQNDDMYSLMLFVLVLVTLVNVVLNRIDQRFQARRRR